MDDLIENNKWIKKIRVLTQGLIISGALNLGFLTTFTVMAVKNMQKKSLHPERLTQSSQKNSINLSLGSMELLSQYFELSYDSLLEELLDPQLVEEGSAKRDYALGCLVSFHFQKLRFRGLFIITPLFRQMWKMLSYGSIRH